MLNTLSETQTVDGSAPVLTKAQTEELRRLSEWLEDRVAASKKKPSAEVVTLVPALAKLLMDRNPVNRPISARNADYIASDIASGRFEFNGESIVVSNTGILLDGQHRCLQVVATGKPIETVIVFGPRESARFTIDIGRPKTVSNFLAMKNRRYSSVLAAAVGYHVQLRKFNRLLYGGKVGYPTKAEVLAAADEMRGIDSSVELTSAAMKSPVRSHAILALCHYVFWKKAGREAADHFILRVIDGDGIRKGDPIHYCRDRLAQMGRLVAGCDRAELVFKCWNAHRRGERITHFKLTGGELPKVER